jgi:ABC-type transporter Mla subunit MlaD
MASSLDGINSSISTTLGTAACNASDRRQLLSICLHIVAEALRGENASPDILSQYVGALSALSARLVPLLNSNQIKLLRNLQNTEALRQELS